jgi:hypothetical protein
MPNYKFCAECKTEHDEFGRTREENEAIAKQEEKMEPEKPKSQRLREALAEAKLLASRAVVTGNPTLTLGYVEQVALDPTPAVQRLQRLFTQVATQPVAIKDPATGAHTFTEVGDSIAATLRMAADALYSTHDSDENHEAIKALVLQVLEQCRTYHAENKERLQRVEKQQAELIKSLTLMMEMEMEEAIREAEAREAVVDVPFKEEEAPQQAQQAPAPDPTERQVWKGNGLTAEEKAAAIRAEQAMLQAIARANKGKVH